MGFFGSLFGKGGEGDEEGGVNPSQVRVDVETREEIKVISNFSDREVNRLIKTFRQADSNSDGLITAQELVGLQMFKFSPFADRIMTVYDKDGSGALSITEFAEMLSVFSERASKDQKMRFVFQLYDFDGDGRIGADDLKETIDRITGKHLSSEEVFELAAKVLQESDSSGDGFLNFDDFSKVVVNSDLDIKVTAPIV